MIRTKADETRLIPALQGNEIALVPGGDDISSGREREFAAGTAEALADEVAADGEDLIQQAGLVHPAQVAEHGATGSVIEGDLGLVEGGELGHGRKDRKG